MHCGHARRSNLRRPLGGRPRRPSFSSRHAQGVLPLKPLLFVVAIAALGATAVQAEESEPSDAEPQPSVKSPSFFNPPEFVLRLSDYFRVGRADASDGDDAASEADQAVHLAASPTAH